jgi:FkbH-like protein
MSKVLQARKKWQGHEKALFSGEVRPDFTVGITATFTIEPLVPYIGANLLDIGFHPEVKVAPYNQVHQACLAPGKVFGNTEELKSILILWRIDDMLGDELSDFLMSSASALGRAEQKLAEFLSALKSLKSDFPGSVITCIPPYPDTGHSAIDDLAITGGAGFFHRSILNTWIELLGSIPDIHILDLNGIQSNFGIEHSLDRRKWYLYRQPFSEQFLHYMAGIYGRLMRTLYTEQKKCIVLDCDNTLWGGIVGEDGLDRLQLGDEFPGMAFRDFQNLLLSWNSRGGLISLCSKNNEADVWEVFEKHDAMVLKQEHLAAWRINWENKPSNLSGIAKELNISTDSMIFIDDNPFEIERMKEAHPEVNSVLLPDDPAMIVDEINNLNLFDRLNVTREDRQRTEMLRHERKRTELREELSEEDFLRSLNLVLEVFEPGVAHVARVAQLINKTNQFNLTTWRLTQDEVQSVLDSGSRRIFSVRVSDKFGHYGLTGLAMIRPDGDSWHMENFLLSCRVLGRKVETGLLAFIATQAQQAGVKNITAEFIPTPKNTPARDMLPAHGFLRSENGIWSIGVADVPEAPDFIRYG